MRFLWWKRKFHSYEYYYNQYPERIRERLSIRDIHFVERVLAICRDAGVGMSSEEIWEALLRYNSSIDVNMKEEIIKWISQVRSFVMEAKEAYPSGLSRFFKRKDEYEV
ncbi:MAG: hypothetical protein ACP5K2_03665 [bacterium]